MTSLALTIRQQFKEGDDIRDKGLKTPKSILRMDDIHYGEEPLQVMDIYRLKKHEGKKLPVIISVHGGGWVYGDKERYQYYCMSLAKHGFAVVNFSYRLAPEYKFPAGIEDLNTVVTWLLDHQEEYHLDMNHLFALGDSAGAHMLSLYSCMNANPKYAATYDFTLPTFKFKAIALNCGAYNLMKEGNDLTSGLMKEILKNKGTKKEFKQISPINFITEEYPPVFVMTCSGDFLKDEVADLLPVLEKNNIPFEYHYYTSPSKKDLGHVFHCNMKLKEAKICNKEECDYFKKFID